MLGKSVSRGLRPNVQIQGGCGWHLSPRVAHPLPFCDVWDGLCVLEVAPFRRHGPSIFGPTKHKVVEMHTNIMNTVGLLFFSHRTCGTRAQCRRTSECYQKTGHLNSTWCFVALPGTHVCKKKRTPEPDTGESGLPPCGIQEEVTSDTENVPEWTSHEHVRIRCTLLQASVSAMFLWPTSEAAIF